jgi:hypothetical protein
MKRFQPACGFLLCGVISASCASEHAVRTSPRPLARPQEDVQRLAAEVSAEQLHRSVVALASFGTRHTLADTTSTTRGTGAARAWIHAEFERIAADSGGRLVVEYQSVRVTQPTERIPQPATLVNVLATLPGTAPLADRRVIIVSGHYDSRVADVMDATSDAPGANDDASGTALVLEAARVLSAAGHAYRHTIVFAAVAGEEQALNGSDGLARKARQENWPVIAMLDDDIVGNSTGGSGLSGRGRVRVFSEGVPTAETPLQIQLRQTLGGESDGPSRQLARYIGERAMDVDPDFAVTQTFRRDRYGRGGDHVPFLRQGYAAVRFTEPYENLSRQHADVTVKDGRKEGDLPEFVDYGYLASVTRVNVATLAALALAPAAPSAVLIDPSLSYDTTLTWDPVPGASGYAVRLRDTTSPTWQQRINVGPTTRAVLKNISKDDDQFAVEAYDPQGHVSLPTAPTPLTRRPKK